MIPLLVLDATVLKKMPEEFLIHLLLHIKKEVDLGTLQFAIMFTKEYLDAMIQQSNNQTDLEIRIKNWLDQHCNCPKNKIGNFIVTGGLFDKNSIYAKKHLTRLSKNYSITKHIIFDDKNNHCIEYTFNENVAKA